MSHAKFRDVPTEPLFAASAPAPAPAPASLGRATCPACAHALVGDVGRAGPRDALRPVVRLGEHVVWAVHQVTTTAGRRVPCRTSGVALCIAPPRDERGVRQRSWNRCPHGAEPPPR